MKALGIGERLLIGVSGSDGADTNMYGSVFCSLAAASTLLTCPAARAEDLWSCEVMLCLAAPGGWAGIPACHPPMERLRHHLSRKRAFPSCPQGSVPATSPLPVQPSLVVPRP
jgi:hypothetical protein